MARVAIYLRSSKDRHDVSVESQRRELRAFVEQLGDTLVAEFDDKVESAKTDDRPGFQAMVAEARRKDRRFEKIVCYDTSRFSRRQVHAKVYKHELRKLGIDVAFLKLPKTDSYVDGVLESMMEAFDELHSEKSKSDGLRGMRENVQSGWRAGGRAPFGYRLEKTIVGSRDGQPVTKSKLIPDPRRFDSIKAYLDGRARGEGRMALSTSLRLHMSFTSLASIEDNALTYAGHTVWNRHSEKIDGRYVNGRKTRSRDEWVIRRNTHPAMITEAQAEAILAQRAINGQKHKRARRSPYLLSGVLKCRCGASLDGDGGYYKCRNRCGARSIRQQSVEQAVIDLIFEDVFTPQVIAELGLELKRQAAAASKKARGEEPKLRAQLRDAERKIRDLSRLLTEVKHPRPLLAQLDKLEEERAEIAARMDADQRSRSAAAHTDPTDAQLQAFVGQYRSAVHEGSADRRKAVLNSLIQKAILDGDELTVVPNFTPLTGVNLASPRGFEPRLPP